MSEVSAAGDLLDRSRGLGVGADGRIWVAATPTGVLGVIDPENGEDLRLPLLVEGTAGQPVDVAQAADGYVYATDAAAGRLIRLSPDGRLERTWPLPPANSLDGPHLAFDALGNLYVTDPEGGRVEQRNPAGESSGVWSAGAMIEQAIKAVGLAVGPDGRIWLTDSSGGTVTVITPE
jgi:streptogramin lyase